MPRGTFTHDGKRYDIRARTEKELAVKIALKKKELEEGKQTVDGDTKIAVWAEFWLDTHKRNDVSEGWFNEIEKIVNSIVIPAIGGMKIKDVRPIHLKKIINNYKGYSRSYQSKIKNIIHEMLEDARKNRMVLENPADNLDLPQAREMQKRRPITEHEREHILRVSQFHRAGIFIKIMLNCGLRPSEVVRLLVKDVDLNEMVIKVVGKTKSESGKRIVPIPALFIPCLELHLKGRGPFDLVCTNASGGKLTKSSREQMWNSFIYQLNISMGCETYKGKLMPPYRVADDLVMYDLRHTYCTDLEKSGVPLNRARVLMGHKTIAMTAEVYTHVDQEAMEDTRDKINQYQGVAKGVASILESIEK